MKSVHLIITVNYTKMVVTNSGNLLLLLLFFEIRSMKYVY